MKLSFFCMGIFIIFSFESHKALSNNIEATKKKSHKKVRKMNAGKKKKEAQISASSEVSYWETFSSRLHFRPILSYSFINPTALNTVLADFAKTNKLNSSYKIGGSPTISIAADYELTQRFSIGLRLDWFSTGTDTIHYQDNGRRANLQTTVSGLPIYATFTAKQPLLDYLSFGLTGGIGVPVFYHSSVEVSGSNMPGYPNGSAIYSGNSFTGFGLAFADYDLDEKIKLRTEAGYRLLSSNQMTLTDNYSTLKAGEILADPKKTAIPIDSSSFFLGASAIISL